MSGTILRVNRLTIGIESADGAVNNAVSDVSFNIKDGEILGIVGESGCGKSLTALAIAGLLPKNAVIASGKIIFNGMELNEISRDEMAGLQGKDITMVFQEPMTSMNPLLTVGRQVSESLRIHYKLTEKEMKQETLNSFRKVGLPRPEELYGSYPHQLSGGMLQRAMLAMAIICKPKLIIADEPTTALDVTIQAQILELLKSINLEYGTAVLFISHDLGVINRLCDRIAVMYAGSMVEEGSTRNIFIHPVHEYTKGLIGSIPQRECKGKRLVNIPGRVPAITEKKTGCSFAPRCGMANDRCFLEKPGKTALGPGHDVCCYLAEKESEMEYVSI